MIPNFRIEDNLKVEFFLPDTESDSFILGFSVIGGTDTLGGYDVFIIGTSLLGGSDLIGPALGYKWQSVNCVTSQLEMSVGGDLQDAYLFQPIPGSTQITLQSFEYDPTNNPYIRANTKIRIRLEDEEIDRVIYQGSILTINVIYYPEGLNLVTINAVDAYENLVNQRFATWDTTSLPGTAASTRAIIDLVGIASGLGTVIKGQRMTWFIPKVVETDIQVNQIINEVTSVGQYIMWIDPVTQSIAYVSRPTEERTSNWDGSPVYSISNNHEEDNHLCLAELEVSSDKFTMYNSIKTTLASDPTKVYVDSDQDLIDLYGELTLDVTVNIDSEASMIKWSKSLFNNRSDNLLKSVVTPTIDRLGNLTAAAFFEPGQVVRVNYTTNQVAIQGFYSIIKVSHRVDIDNWFTTLDLWKAA